MTTQQFNIGDKVSVLDEAVNGVVVSIKNNEIGIETENGFPMSRHWNLRFKKESAQSHLTT